MNPAHRLGKALLAIIADTPSHQILLFWLFSTLVAEILDKKKSLKDLMKLTF
jgi:hypothetical protein